MKAKLGFLGLGVMGSSIAVNLMKGGFRLNLWNRSRKDHVELQHENGTFTKSPAEAVRDVDIILYSLSNDEAIENVIFGPEGVLSGIHEGQLAINLGTVHPEMSKREAAAYNHSGVAYLDAPVFGSKNEAEAADLCIVIGGNYSDYLRALPVFAAMSSSTHYMGETGKGAAMGLVGSLMVCMQLEALGEGLILAQKAGLMTEKVVEILGIPDFRSPLFRDMGSQIISRNFEPVFTLDHLYKDSNQIIRLADELGVAVPGVAGVREVIKGAVINGWGHENASAMVKALELQSNITVKKKKS